MAGSPIIAECIFTENHAANCGGGCFLEGGAARITDCEFINNTAASGGAIHVGEYTSATIERTRVVGNVAVGFGGGIAIETGGHADIRDCTVISNRGGDGGAICASAATATIDNCTLDSNVCDFGGGIDCVTGCTLQVSRTAILSNQAGFWGGGIYAYDSRFVIADCDLVGNTCAGQGGAVRAFAATFDFQRCRILNNHADEIGDGLYLDRYSPVTIHDSDLRDNGLAIYVQTAPDELVDARENWWGDPTGPYNETNNPAGQGDTISVHILFDPWLQSSDVAEGAVMDDKPRDTAANDRLRLTLYPNPFRGSARIGFRLAAPDRIALVMTDVSGRVLARITDRDLAAGEQWIDLAPTERAQASGRVFLRLHTSDAMVTRAATILR